MQLETQHLILREYTMDDFDALLKFQRVRIDDLEEIFQLYKNAIAKMEEQNMPL